MIVDKLLWYINTENPDQTCVVFRTFDLVINEGLKRKTYKGVMKYITILILGMFLSGCSITEPRVSFGKKCVEEGDKIVYSYIWVYDKEVGVISDDEETCKKLDVEGK